MWILCCCYYFISSSQQYYIQPPLAFIIHMTYPCIPPAAPSLQVVLRQLRFCCSCNQKYLPQQYSPKPLLVFYLCTPLAWKYYTPLVCVCENESNEISGLDWTVPSCPPWVPASCNATIRKKIVPLQVRTSRTLRSSGLDSFFPFFLGSGHFLVDVTGSAHLE